MANKIDDVVAGSQNISGDTLSKNLAFNAQCFLIQSMFEISRKAENVRPEAANVAGLPDPSGQRSARPHPIEKMRDQNWAQSMSRYKYIAPVISHVPGGSSTTYSALIRKKNGDKLAEITPDLMALLVPTLRIYRVDYKAKVDPFDDTKKIPDLAGATTEREIIFDDFVDPNDFERIFTNKQGRLGGTGIKSFQWDLKGVNPGDVDANITAQLNIHFNDVSDLFADAEGVRQTRAGRPGKASFLDLIIYAPQQAATAGIGADDPTYMLYDGVFFEIKAVVGWAVPPQASGMFPRSDGTTLEDFQEAVRHSQTALFLQLTTHRFDFNQDGTANLVINYRARYDNKRNSDDIFNVDIEQRKDLRAIQEEKAEYPDRFKESDKKVPSAGLKKFRKATFDMEALLANRYNQIVNKLLYKLYQVDAKPLQLGVVKGEGDADIEGASMSELNKMITDTKGGKEDYDAAAAQVGIVPNAAQVPEMFLGQANSTAMLEQFFKVGAVTRYDPPRALDAMQSQYITNVTGQYVAADRAAQKRGQKFEAAPDENSPGGSLDKRSMVANTKKRTSYRVPFFFLGDLIEAAIEVLVLNANSPLTARKEMQKFITTDIDFFNLKYFYTLGEALLAKRGIRGRAGASANPLPAGWTPGVYFRDLRLGRLSLSKEQRKKTYRAINIASIPIQFDYFLEWYAQTVAAQRRQFYFINNFIVDVLHQLVRPTLSAQCFHGIPPQQTHIAMIDFMVNKDAQIIKYLFPPTVAAADSITMNYGLGPDPDFSGTSVAEVSTRASSIETLEDRGLVPAPSSPALQPGQSLGAGGPKNYQNIKVITLSTVQPDLLEGDPIDDKRRGIYHFIVGADRGLLKNATFNRMDAPFLKEARIDRNRIAGAEQLRELYNVNLKLYGAPILKPGQLIYVSPSPLGFGNPRDRSSPARFLGIGGYHLITAVQSTIDSQGYQTSIKALHQSMPAVEERIGDWNNFRIGTPTPSDAG